MTETQHSAASAATTTTAAAAANPSGPRLPGYETTFITRSELTDDALKTLKDRLNQVISTHGGELVLNEDWGKRKLAYTIKKETRGHYNYLVYSGKDNVVFEIERSLRLHDHVLRFLTVNLGKDFESTQFKKFRTDARQAAKRREEEREARYQERSGRYHDSRSMSVDDFDDGSVDLEGQEE